MKSLFKTIGRKLLVIALLSAVPLWIWSQGVMLVSDEGAILQGAVNHGESFSEMLTQTEIWLEDLGMKKEEWDERYGAKIKKIQKGVRLGKKVVEINNYLTRVLEKLETYRIQLKKNEWLSPYEKAVLYSEGVCAIKDIINNSKSTIASTRKQRDMKKVSLTASDDLVSKANDNKDTDLQGETISRQEENLDLILASIRYADTQLNFRINRANRIINAKRKFVDNTLYMNTLLTQKYGIR